MRHTGISTATLALTAALALSGCAGAASAGGSGQAAAARTTPTAAVKDPSTLKVGNTALGRILVDGSGRTLYLFTEDGKNTNSMNCDAACLKLWPPMQGKPKAGSGVDAKLIGTTTSGKKQATYAGHPLYYYAKDRKAGDLKGQGIDKIWYVLDSHGKAVKKAVPSTGNTGNTGNTGGYGY